MDKKLTSAKHGDSSKFSFNENEITSESQERTVTELKLLTGHSHNSPYSTDGALVIVNYAEKDLLLDDNLF